MQLIFKTLVFFPELAKSPKKKEVRLNKSVEAVVVGGAWSVLQDQLEFSSGIMKHLAVQR